MNCHEQEDVSFVEEVEEEILEESVGDEEFLASIGATMHKTFLERQAKSFPDFNCEDQSSPHVEEEVFVDADEGGVLEELVEDDDHLEYFYDEQVIEKWFQVDSLPVDLESACRRLIPIVYKGEEYPDPEIMMRRTPLPELYKYLKQHFDYKKDVKKEIVEETAPEVESTMSEQFTLQELFERRTQKPSTMTTKKHSKVVGNIVMTQVVGKVSLQHVNVIGVEEGDDQGFMRKETKEQAISRWLEGDQPPKDLEAACRIFIPLVFDDEAIDPVKIMQRTPLRELFDYLKKNYRHAHEAVEVINDEGFAKRNGVATLQGDGVTANVTEIHRHGNNRTNDIFEESTPFEDSCGSIFEESFEEDDYRSRDGSLQKLGESVYSYFEEVCENGMNDRSFIEEEIFEEIEESEVGDLEIDAIYKELLEFKRGN